MGVDPTVVRATPPHQTRPGRARSIGPSGDTALHPPAIPAAEATVSAGTVRRGLHLTPHQLGEYTKNLGLPIGDRPNYPRYGPTQVHRIVAVQALRELQIPVDDACQAVQTLRSTFADGQGWVVLYPEPHRWVAVPAITVELLTSLLTLTGRAAVIDLAKLRDRAQSAWLHLVTAPADE